MPRHVRPALDALPAADEKRHRLVYRRLRLVGGLRLAGGLRVGRLRGLGARLVAPLPDPEVQGAGHCLPHGGVDDGPHLVSPGLHRLPGGVGARPHGVPLPAVACLQA